VWLRPWRAGRTWTATPYCTQEQIARGTAVGAADLIHFMLGISIQADEALGMLFGRGDAGWLGSRS
jgi:hypothetical protein